MHIDWASQTHVGRTRERNEDAHAAHVFTDPNGESRGLFVVCDGMGGHASGQEASQMAVQVVGDRLKPLLEGAARENANIAEDMQSAVLAANQAIYERNQRAGAMGRERAGTTIVALLVRNDRVWLIHVGDSRAYQITQRAIRLLTADHNVGNREVRRGAPESEAWSRVDADQLTQALGPASNQHVHPELLATAVDDEALFLLCSDGVSDNDFVERAGAELLRPLLQADIDMTRRCEDFVTAANNTNGHDNLTAILVRVSGGLRGHETTQGADTKKRSRPGLLKRIGIFFSRYSA